MKNTVLYVKNIQKDEEYTRILLKGTNPYYEDSTVTLVLEYEEEIPDPPKEGDYFYFELLKSPRIRL